MAKKANDVTDGADAALVLKTAVVVEDEEDDVDEDPTKDAEDTVDVERNVLRPTGKEKVHVSKRSVEAGAEKSNSVRKRLCTRVRNDKFRARS